MDAQKAHDTPAPAPTVRKSALEEYEQSGRPVWILTKTELKLLGIAGVCLLFHSCAW